MILVEIVCAVTFLFSTTIFYATIFATMNMIKTIWNILTGMGKELDQLNTKIDGLSFKFHDIEENEAQILALLLEIKKDQESVLELVQKIQAELSPPPAVALVFKLGGITRGANGMAQVSDTGSVSATLEADDALGNAGAQLDAAPVWSLSDPLLGAVTASADGLSAQVVLTGKLGSFSLHVDALAGGKALAGDSEVVEVVVGAAASLKVAVTVA